MIRLRQLGPAFIHHIEAYGLLVAAAGREMREQGRRRVALAAFGAVLGIAFATLAGGTAIAAAWNTEGHWWVVLGVLAAFGVASASCLFAAFAALPRSSHLAALRDEWQKDKAWLSRRGEGGASDGPVASEPAVPTGSVRRMRGASWSDA